MAETNFTVKIAVQEDGSISLIDQAGAKIASLGQAASGAKAGLGSLEAGTRAAGSAAQASGTQVGEFGNKAGELGSKAQSANGGLSSMASTLISLDAAVRLANTAFDLAKSGVDAFFSGVDRADNLNDLSQKIGVSVTTLSAFELAANTAGTSIEGVGAGFKVLSKNLAEASAGNTAMADSFKKVLGASFDVNAGLSDTNGTMLALADAFAGMEDGGRKTALAMEVLGKSGADLIPFLNQGSEEITRLTTLSAKLGAVISEDTASAADAFNDNLAILGTALTGVGTQIAATMLPALKDLTDTVVEFVANDSTIAAFSATFSGAMKAMSAGIQKIADDLKNLGEGATLSQRLEVIFRDVTPFIISVGGSLAKALWQGFTTVAVSIWNSMDWVDIISTGIFIAIGGPTGGALAFVGHAILEGITGGAVDKAPESASKIVDSLANEMKDNAGQKAPMISNDVFVAMLGGGAALAANLLTGPTQALGASIVATLSAAIATGGIPLIAAALGTIVVGGIGLAFGSDAQQEWNSRLAELVNTGAETVRSAVEAQRDLLEVRLKASIEFDKTDLSGETARLKLELDKANEALLRTATVAAIAEKNGTSYAEALKTVNAGTTAVSAAVDKEAEALKRKEEAQRQAQAVMDGYVAKLNEIKTATEATTAFYTQLNATPVNSDRYMAISQEKEIYDQLVATLGTVEAAQASMAAQDAAYQAAADAVAAKRSQSSAVYVNDLRSQAQAESDHIESMRIAAEQYGVTGQAQSAVAAIIEESSLRMLGASEQEAQAIRAAADEKIQATLKGQAYADQLAVQTEGEKAQMDAVNKNSEAITAHTAAIQGLSAVGEIWQYAADGAISYGDAERAATAAASASKDVFDQAAAARMRLVEITVQQTNENLKAAASSAQNQSNLQAEIAAIDAAEASGVAYANSTLEIEKAKILAAAATQKAADSTIAENAALNASIDKLAQSKIAELELAVAAKQRMAVYEARSQIKALTEETAIWSQVRSGVMTVSQAEHELAVRQKEVELGSRSLAEEFVTANETATQSAEDAKNAYIDLGQVIQGAFEQSFDAVVNGTRDLGKSLEGIGISIGKQWFSAILKDKLNFDMKVKANFLDLGDFGTSSFGKMFSGIADMGKSLFGGGGGGGSGFFESFFGGIKTFAQGLPLIGRMFGGGSTPAPDYTGGGYTGVGSLAYQGEPDYLGSGVGAIGGAAGMVNGINAMAGTATSSLNSVAGAMGAVAGAAAVLGAVLPLLLPIFEKLFDTTTKGTKERRKGESELDSSATFAKLQQPSKLGDFTRDTNKELGLFENYKNGVATAIENGMKEGEANAIKGAGEGVFSVIFKKDGDKMVNGAMDMGRGMAEFLSRGLADGMTYDEMIGSLRKLADENDITFRDALIGVNNFGKAAMKQFGEIGQADWGAAEFADSLYGITEIFKGDFPAGVNLASIALQSMEKDGTKAFSNLDASTKNWILSVANDAEAFKTVIASLSLQGFTIDTAEFEQTLADITASATFVGNNISQLLSASTIGEGMKGIGQALKTEIQGALSENMLGDLFDTTGIATAFQDLFANIRQLKSGEMSSGDFMSGMAEAIASGKANLDEYIPKIKAMREAMAEVEAAVDEAFKPTAAEELAARTLAMADGLKGAFGTGIGAALDAALAEGGSTGAGLQAFADSMRTSIKDSVKSSIVQGMVEAATLKGPLAELMATFGQAFQGAIIGGISADEQAMLNALLGQIGTVADQTIAYLSPSVEAVLALGGAAETTLGKMDPKTVGVPTDPALAQFKKDVEEAQATLQSGFSSAVSAAFSAIGQGKSVEEATAAFSESFKTSISQSVAAGLQEALVQSAVMEGALGSLMAQFKEATAAAMADGVITGAEQAQLAGLAQQIKTTGESAAAALAPVVASVATIATGVTSGAGDVQFAVATQAEATTAQADAAIATSATTATATVATATETAATTLADAATTMADTLSDALGTAGSTSSDGIASEAQARELAMKDAMAQAGTAISEGATAAGVEYQQVINAASQAIGAAAAQGSADSSATLTTAYQEAAAAAQAALGTAGETLSGDVTDAANSLRDSVSEILGTSESISKLAPEAAYGIGQSLADVRDQVAPEMQTQIDSMIAALSDASLTPEESAALASTFDSLSQSVSPDAASSIAGGIDALKDQLDAGRLSSLTEPLADALGSLTSPSDDVRSALDRIVNPAEDVTNQMGDLAYAMQRAISTINSAASTASAGTPAAATGGSFARGSAVVGEAGSPELVTAGRSGGFTVKPLTWPQARALMHGGTPGMAVGGVVGGGNMGGGGNTLPPPPPKPTGGGYKANADDAEFADFTSAIVDAFRAGFEGSKGFIEDFSDSINEAVRGRLVDAIMQGFSESPAIQQYAENIDTLITKAQELAGNNKLSAEELANIQSQIKQNTDAIGAQADQIDELLEPLRQAEAISTAFSQGLDFSGALRSLAENPDDLEGFRRNIDQTVNDAVLNGAIEGLLASGPIQDAVKKFGDTMNDAMAKALEDGVLTAEESDALHDLAVSGSAEMKTAMEAMGPVLSALGIDLGDSLSEGVNRAKETMKTASSAMDPFASLGEGETQFGNFTQSIRDQVYGNIKDGLIQAFIDSAVTNGLLAGPMMAIQTIFDQIGQKQLTTQEANAKLAEQVALINGSLNDPAFKAAFDSTMASIQTVGTQLGQSSKAVVESAASSREVVQEATKDVCQGKCALEKRTSELGFAAVNTFGRTASVSVEQMLPKLAVGGLVTKKTTAIIGEAGPELVLPVKDLGTKDAIESLASLATGGSSPDLTEALKAAMAQRASGDGGSLDGSSLKGIVESFDALSPDVASNIASTLTAFGSIAEGADPALADKVKQASEAMGQAATGVSTDLMASLSGIVGSMGVSADSIDAQAAQMEKLKDAMTGSSAGFSPDDIKSALTGIGKALDPDIAATAKDAVASFGSVSGAIGGDLMASLAGIAGSLGSGAESIDAQAAEMEKLKAAMTAGGALDPSALAAAMKASPVVPTDAELKAQADRVAALSAASATPGGAPVTIPADFGKLVSGTEDTVSAIKDLHDRIDKLSDAILAQPTEVNVQMDRETLMRAMAKADRFKKKARYGVTA